MDNTSAEMSPGARKSIKRKTILVVGLMTNVRIAHVSHMWIYLCTFPKLTNIYHVSTAQLHKIQ